MILFVAIQTEFEESKTEVKTKMCCNNGITATSSMVVQEFNCKTTVLS